MRIEAAVALEQLASADSTKALEKQLQEEKDPKVQKDLIRALAACGSKEAKVRKDIMRRARSEKDLLVRRNAIFALSNFAPDGDCLAVLDAVMQSGSDEDKRTAALALAIRREEAWRGALDEQLKTAVDGPVKTTIETALAVSNGADLATIGNAVAALCKDSVERVRTYGRPNARRAGG
jgi:HEAT repeat protein